MKYTIIVVVLLALGGAALWLGMSASPEVETPQDSNNDQVNVDQEDLIEVEFPQAGEIIGNPALVSGQARGYWFFEGSAPVVVVDWDGKIIGEGYITAEDDWMTEEFVSFSGSILYNLPDDAYSTDGTIIFRRANPSGLPENDAAYEVRGTLTTGVVDVDDYTVIPDDAVFCTEEQKAAEFCTEEYMPVCGYVEVQCITEPCEPVQETFSNGCHACASEQNVVAYTPGECVVE